MKDLLEFIVIWLHGSIDDAFGNGSSRSSWNRSRHRAKFRLESLEGRELQTRSQVVSTLSDTVFTSKPIAEYSSLSTPTPSDPGSGRTGDPGAVTIAENSSPSTPTPPDPVSGRTGDSGAVTKSVVASRSTNRFLIAGNVGPEFVVGILTSHEINRHHPKKSRRDQGDSSVEGEPTTRSEERGGTPSAGQSSSQEKPEGEHADSIEIIHSRVAKQLNNKRIKFDYHTKQDILQNSFIYITDNINKPGFAKRPLHYKALGARSSAQQQIRRRRKRQELTGIDLDAEGTESDPVDSSIETTDEVESIFKMAPAASLAAIIADAALKEAGKQNVDTRENYSRDFVLSFSSYSDDVISLSCSLVDKVLRGRMKRNTLVRAARRAISRIQEIVQSRESDTEIESRETSSIRTKNSLMTTTTCQNMNRMI